MPDPRPHPDRTSEICVVGAGYVGLTAAACFAALGHHVRCVENDAQRLSSLHEGVIPIFEPGLDALVAEGVEAGRLLFTSDIAEAVRGADVAFLCVGTPRATTATQISASLPMRPTRWPPRQPATSPSP